MFRDPLFIAALALFTAFVAGRASTRRTWRLIKATRVEIEAIEAISARWRQHDAPVPEWPTALPAGSGVRELTARAVFEPPPELAAPARSGGPAVGRHRRHVWVGFWAASSTPRDPQARIAAAMQRADSVTPLPEAVRVLAGLVAPEAEATAAEVLAAAWAQPRELVGAAT